MKAVKIIFANPAYNYWTAISATATEEMARKYFIGSYFDMGVFPTENMQKCINIEFNQLQSAAKK